MKRARRFEPRRLIVRLILGRRLKAGLAYFTALDEESTREGDHATERFAFGSWCQLFYLYQWAYRGADMTAPLRGDWRFKRTEAIAMRRLMKEGNLAPSIPHENVRKCATS